MIKSRGLGHALGIIAMSDLHCGSLVGLWPREFTLQAGNATSLNPFQNKLSVVFGKATESALKEMNDTPFYLLLNGDLTEGTGHHKSIEYMSPNPEDEKEAVCDLVRPYTLHKNYRGAILTKGTEPHTWGWEESIAKRLNAVVRPQYPKQRTFSKAVFDIGGCTIDATHHMSTTSRAYLEASAMSILMGNARVNYARDGLAVPKVFIRSHRHCPGYYCDARGLFLVLGAWQGLTRYGYKAVPDSHPYPALATLKFPGHGVLPAVKLHGEPLLQEEHFLLAN